MNLKVSSNKENNINQYKKKSIAGPLNYPTKTRLRKRPTRKRKYRC
jgi:hypothetical protein